MKFEDILDTAYSRLYSNGAFNSKFTESSETCSRGTIVPIRERSLYIYRDLINFTEGSNDYVSMELTAHNEDYFVEVKVIIPGNKNDLIQTLKDVNEMNKTGNPCSVYFNFDTEQYEIKSYISFVGYDICAEQEEENDVPYYSSSPEIEGLMNLISAVLGQAEHLLNTLIA